MDLQNTFYLLGIIYMVLGVFILIGIVVLLFYMKKKITDIHDIAAMRIEQFNDLTEPVQRAARIVKRMLPNKKG